MTFNQMKKPGLVIAIQRLSIWLLILSCFMAGWMVDRFRYKKENYRFLWKKVAEHEQRILKLEGE